MRFYLSRMRWMLFGAAACGSVFAQAADKSWSGGGENNNWTTSLNWVGGLAPSPGDSLLFDTFARLTPNNNYSAGTQFNGITFGPAAGPFTLTGNALTLVGLITDNTPILTETINLPLILGATTNVSVADNAFLLLASPASGAFSISKTGNGTLTLGAANTFSGPLLLDDGVVSASADNNLGAVPASASPGRIIIDGGTLRATTGFSMNANRGIGLGPTGGTFDVFSGQTLSYSGVIAFDGAGAGGLTKVRFGTLTLSGANTYIGPTNVRNGALILNFADTAATTPITNIINPSSMLTLGGATAGLGQNNNATLTLTGKASVNSVQTFAGTNIDIYGSVISVTNGTGGTATLNLGALTHTLGGTVVIPTNSGTVNTTTSVATTNGILGGWAVAGTPDVQRGITMGTAYATVDASGKIVPYTAHVAAPEYLPGNNVTLLRNDPAVIANADKNLRFTGDATARLMRVDLENAGTTTDINTFAFTTAGANNTLVIGTGNTLRLGKFGGIYKQANGNNQLYIGGSTDTPQTGNGTASSTTPSQVGFLTAGGPTSGSPGEIVLTTNETANNNGTLNIEASIVDNGPGGAVTLIKTSVSSVKIDGHNTYSGGTFINQGRFQLAGSEVGRMVNPAGGADLTLGNTDGLGTGPVTVAPGGYLFVSGVNGTGLFTGNGAIPGAIPNTAQNAPIPNNMTLSGNGTNQEGIGAIRLGGKAILSGQITLGGDARIGGSSNNGNTEVAYDTYPAINPDGTTLYIDPSHLLSGKITGPFSLDIGSNVSISTNFKISNPANDWAGDTTFVTGGGTTRLRIGANEVIPHGPGKGNLVWGPLVGANVARFDLNGFNETVNGLSTTTTTLTSAIIENNGFTPTIIPDPANPGLKTYSFAAGTSTLTVGSFDQTATFGGVIRDSDTMRTVSLPDPNGGATALVVTAPWATAGANVALIKIGTGIQTLSGANTYTGPTTINAGTLSITGSLATSGNVAVNSGGTLSGAGDGSTTGLIGNLTMAPGSSIAPGATSALGSVGTLTMTGLMVNGGDFKFNLVSPGASDLVNVNGPVNFTAASTITPNGGVAGTYTVLSTTAGPITYGAVPTVTPFVDPLTRPTSYALDTTSDTSAIKLIVTGGPKSITWTGAVNGDWDINTTSNWTDGAITEKFFNGDLVTFGDVINRNVTLTTTVLPSSVTVNNSVGMNYVIGGAGGIGGAPSGLIKSGAGTLTLTSNNTYTGPTTISEGTLEVGNGGTSGTLGAGDVANSTTLIFNRSDAMTVPNAISGGGELRKIGTGAVTLSGASTYTGPTNIVAGTLKISRTASLGALSSAVTVSSGGALDVGGATTANSVNFSDPFSPKQFNIAGDGVGGTGAITNSGTVVQQNAFQKIKLTANATVGGTGRFDMRDPDSGSIPELDLSGFTLTKSGPNQFTLVGATVTGGNIVVNEGVFALETTTALSSSAPGTVTFNAPASGTTALQFFNATGDITRPMVFNGNGVLIGNASAAAQPSAFGSNITLNGDVIFTNLNNSAGALTVNGSISQTGATPRSITKNGPTTLNLNGTNTYTGTTTVNDGVLRVTGSLNTNNDVLVAAPATFAVEGTASSVGGISGAGVTTVGGPFGTALTASHVRQSSLTIADGSQVKTKNGGGASVLGTLSIAGTPAAPTAKLDLNNNSAIIDYTGASPAATLRQQILAGRGGPGFGAAWTGPGITSSAAAAANVAEPESRSIGYAENSELPLGSYTNFKGQPVDNTSVLSAYTRTADANLDGVVNDDDVTIVGATYAPGVPNPNWALGDFDYNGFIDDDDVTLLGVFYNPSAPPIPVPAAGASGGGVAAVPEPSTAVLLSVMAAAVAAVAAARRRVTR